jgi:nitroreductase
MVREFTDQPVAADLIGELLDLARRAPSAGNTQGSEFLVLEGAASGRFWDCTLPAGERAGFAWPGLLRAPVLIMPLASQQAYLSRYDEPDKANSRMGPDPQSWPVPFWDTDCAFATMNLLLAAHSRSLGALFFAIVRGREELMVEFGIPGELSPLGAVAIGWPAPGRSGASVARKRRAAAEVVHWGQYGGQR